jgi:hypothetical protein
MTKSAKTTPKTTSPRRAKRGTTPAKANSDAALDAALLATVRRHEQLWRRMDDLVASGGDDATDTPEYQAASQEAMDLEFEIVLIPAHTRRGLAGKRRVMGQSSFEDNCGFFDWVLDRDAERVAG